MPLSTLVGAKALYAVLLHYSQRIFFLSCVVITLCHIRYPDIKKFIVQDLPETKEAAESFIKSKGLSDRVIFEAQDFFKPQQRKGKYVFVMQRGLPNSRFNYFVALTIQKMQFYMTGAQSKVTNSIS